MDIPADRVEAPVIAATLAATAALLAPLAPVIGGDSILVDGRRCTVGFNVKTAAGAHRLALAGYCLGRNNPIEIVTPPAGATPTALVRGGAGTTVTVKGATSAAVGQTVCKSSPTTGWRCGTVTAKNVTVTFPGGVVRGLTRASICNEPGDVGAPVMTPGGQAQGITVGGSGNCTSGGTTYFMPIAPVLSAYGLTLYTG